MFQWKIVWITGASSGIGADIARQLAVSGVRVAASSRNAVKLAGLAAEHSNIHSYPLDVTDAAAVAAVFSKIEMEMGPIDLIVAGAGTYKPVGASQIDPVDFDYMYRVNYLGVIHVLAAILPVFRQRRRGHISWIASVAGYRGLPKAAAYGPTKAALINLAESLKPELERDGLVVSVINPGFVRTPMTSVNEFNMPFLMNSPDAARATLAGLAKGKFEVAYPTPFVVILKFARLLPYTVYFWLVRRLARKGPTAGDG